MSKYLRLARLIELMSVIKFHSDWGAKKLAEYFEISEKRLYDDLNELNAANIPIVYNGKGYSFLSIAALPSVQFTVDEALALLMGSAFLDQHKDDVYSPIARGAANKLIELLPESIRKRVLALEGKVCVETKGKTDANHALKIINESVTERKTLRFDYFSYSQDKTTSRRVDPFGIIFRGNSWYTIGYCHTRREPRTFRVNRISNIAPTDDMFVYPEDFSIQEYVAKSWAVFQGEEIEVVLRFSKKLAPLIEEHQWQPDQVITKHKDGSVTFRTRVRGTLEIRRWILSWGRGVKVIAPVSLRDEVAIHARALLRANEGKEDI
jgi:predicted DNA-binding transcriptional regulator YafY